jgi:glycosyltransferase involved in cell wall biosynthesis
MKKTLSLITPVFNEPKINQNLPIIDRELAKTGLPYEIIAINDGSDAVTTTLLNSVNLPSLRTFTYASNKGKGFALRYGFEQSIGDLICLMDADLQLHPQQIALYSNLMSLVEADIVVGSKRHPLSQVQYGPHRRLYSWGYQQLVRLLFNLNLTDTQVGLKLFRRHVLEKVMPRLSIKAWAFDLELLVVAKHLGFIRILEAPIHLSWQPGKSNINWTVIPKMLQDTLAIFYRKYLLRFYDRAPKKPLLEEVSTLTSDIEKTSKLGQPTESQTHKLPLRESQPPTSGIIFAADKT